MALHHFHEFDPYELILELLIPTSKLKVHQIFIVICYVKDESENLSTMINALKQIVSYEKLGILAPFEGVCFGHALSKAFLSTTFDESGKLESSGL
jgi:hypothetical protein